MDTTEHCQNNKENLPIAVVNKQESGGSDQWEAIRNLDEEENWSERTSVLSKGDHLQLVQCAQEILADVVDNLPIESEHSQHSGPPDSVQLTDNDFQFSAAQFDVDYLERISSETSEPSALSRQSLYVKFDPLVGRDSPKLSRGPDEGVASSDLLMLNTPPSSSVSKTSSVTGVASHKDTIGKKKQVHFGFSPLTKTSASDNLPSTESPLSRSSEKALFERTLIDSSPRTHLSHSNEQVQESHTDYHPAGDVSIPETDILVKVLEYSEEDIISIKESARKETREKETKKKDEEVAAWRQKIAVVRREMKKLQHADDSVRMSMTTHRTKTLDLEAEVQKCWDIVDAHERRETDTLDHHQELVRDIGQIEEQRDLLRTDISSLENFFDDLHKRYLKMKHVHQTLTDEKQELEKYQLELEVWNNNAHDHLQRLKQEIQANDKEVEDTFEHMRKENRAKLAVEKAKANQLQMQISSLQDNIQQKKEEKQQLAQMCDEVMKELN